MHQISEPFHTTSILIFGLFDDPITSIITFLQFYTTFY